MFEENLSLFFDFEHGFATLALIKSGEGKGRNVLVIFEQPYKDVRFGKSKIADSNPLFLCKTKDLVSIKEGDFCEHQEKIYQIISIEDDGFGLTKVSLFEDFLPTDEDIP
jgi:hypothetical protein